MNVLNVAARYRFPVIVALAVATLMLTVAVLLKEGVVPIDFLTSRKDEIASFSTLVELALLIAASVLAYVRFFKGRTFTRRLRIELSASVIATDSARNLHSIKVGIANVGHVAIWNPRVAMKVRYHGGENERDEYSVTNWLDEFSMSRDIDRVVEPDESLTAHTTISIPQSVQAVTYIVRVRAEGGIGWTQATTIANSISN